MPTHTRKPKTSEKKSSSASRTSQNPTRDMNPLMRLQQTVGNQAVHRLIENRQNNTGLDRDGDATRVQRADAPPKADLLTEDEKKQLSPVRQELLTLFGEFEKAVVGEAKHDFIMTLAGWDKIKDDEAKAIAQYEIDKKEYPAELEKFNKGLRKDKPPFPIPVPKFTTCILTQNKLLAEAFKRSGEDIRKAGKTPTFNFGTMGKINAEKIGEDIWHESRPNDSERPKTGDIIILAKRGSKVDKAAQTLVYIMSQNPKLIEKTSESNDKAQTALEAATSSQTEAKAAYDALVEANTAQTDAAFIRAKVALSASVKALQKAQEKAAWAASELEKAQNQIPDYQKKLDEARAAVDHEKTFIFSHVGFLQKIIKSKDNPENGPETWITFDGGQSVQEKGLKQGTQTVIRIYHPKTNEISGEKSQGGDARWVQGWINVDKLVNIPYE